MTLDESIDEAKSLWEQSKRLWEIATTIRNYKEPEVQLRAETLRNMILLLSNDSLNLLKEWEKEKAKE